MDILKPQLLWIDGRCYRKNFTKNSQGINQDDKPIESNKMVLLPKRTPDNEIWTDEVCDEEIEDSIDIKKLGESQYNAVLSIPSAFFGFIIGTKGAMKKKIEMETGTRISIPSGDTGDTFVTGKDCASIKSAITRIEVITGSARQRLAFTHFLSIPLCSDQIQRGFQEFKKTVLKNCEMSRGVKEKIFQNPEKLHLTLGTLVLLDSKEEEKAAQIMADLKPTIIRDVLCNESLSIRVKGIEYMNDDPSEVDVLYAQIQCTDGTNRLQDLAETLKERFKSTGLMIKQFEKVKLHLTLMNTKFRSDHTASRQTFDARVILKEMDNFSFGKQEIEAIHLSKLHSGKKDGYYFPTATIDIL